MKIKAFFSRAERAAGSPMMIVVTGVAIATAIGGIMMQDALKTSQDAQMKKSESTLNNRLIDGLDLARQDLVNIVQLALQDGGCTYIDDYTPPVQGPVPLRFCQEVANYQPSQSGFATNRDQFSLTCVSAGADTVYGPSSCTTSTDSLPHSWRVKYTSSKQVGQDSLSAMGTAYIQVAFEKLKDYSLLITGDGADRISFGGGTHTGKVGVFFEDPTAASIHFLSSETEPLNFKQLFSTNVGLDQFVEGSPDSDNGYSAAVVQADQGFLSSAPSVSLTSDFEDLFNNADYGSSTYFSEVEANLWVSGGKNYLKASGLSTYTSCQDTCMQSIGDSASADIDSGGSGEVGSGGRELLDGDDGRGGGDSTMPANNTNTSAGCTVDVRDSCQVVTETTPLTGPSGIEITSGSDPVISFNSSKLKLYGETQSSTKAEVLESFTIGNTGDFSLYASVDNTSNVDIKSPHLNPAAFVSRGGRMLLPSTAKALNGNTLSNISKGIGLSPLGTSFKVEASLVALEGDYLSLADDLINPNVAQNSLGSLVLEGSMIGKNGAELRLVNANNGEVAYGFDQIISKYDTAQATNPAPGFVNTEGAGLVGVTTSIDIGPTVDISYAATYFEQHEGDVNDAGGTGQGTGL